MAPLGVVRLNAPGGRARAVDPAGPGALFATGTAGAGPGVLFAPGMAGEGDGEGLGLGMFGLDAERLLTVCDWLRWRPGPESLALSSDGRPVLESGRNLGRAR